VRRREGGGRGGDCEVGEGRGMRITTNRTVTGKILELDEGGEDKEVRSTKWRVGGVEMGGEGTGRRG